MNLIKRFCREEEGMESMQAIMILAAAAVIIIGLKTIWNALSGTLQSTMNSFVNNPFSAK
jgi:hypothetical protein